MLVNVLILAIILLALLMLWRNNRVFRYRQACNARIHLLNTLELQTGKVERWRQRYDEMDTVSYDDMMRAPWRRLDRFYAPYDWVPDRSSDHGPEKIA